MSVTEKILAKMRNNPRDWQIDALIALAQRYGMVIRKPKSSHVVFSCGALGEVSVPAHRPIKPVYIIQFIALVDAIRAQEG